MNRLEKHLEEMAMQYAEKSGHLLAIISGIDTILNVTKPNTNCDAEWALKEIRRFVERAKGLESDAN